MSEEERVKPVIDDDNDEEERQSNCSQCLTKIGCSVVAKVVYKWPRTCGILFGVVSRVVWLRAISEPVEVCAKTVFDPFRLLRFFR